MSFSYSKVETFHNCPYQYKLRYKDKLETVPDMRETCALYIGTSVHEGIEKRSIDSAIDSYCSHYQKLSRIANGEIEKIKSMVSLAIKEIPEGDYEVRLSHPDSFIGFIDMLVKIDDNLYDLYDFKASSNPDMYRESGQIHVYRYYYEKLTGNKVRNMYYAVIPKCKDILTESVSESDYKKLVDDFYSDKHVNFIKIEFDRQKVNYFFARKAMMDKADKNEDYPKRKSWKCNWCDYSHLCQSNGNDLSDLTDDGKLKYRDLYIKEVSLF